MVNILIIMVPFFVFFLSSYCPIDLSLFYANMLQATWPQYNFYSNYKGLFLTEGCLCLLFLEKEASSRPILLNKIGSKKNVWIPRLSECSTSTRSLASSLAPKMSGCIYGSVDITWAFFLCRHKFALCTAFMQRA